MFRYYLLEDNTVAERAILYARLYQAFLVFIFIANLLNKLQIHSLIVIFKIHQLHLYLLLLCSLPVTASHSLDELDC